MGLGSIIRRVRRKLGREIGGFELDQEFFTKLIVHTGNFGKMTWLGRPIWQNVLDLWIIQETIAEVKPALLIETGTNRGGSSLFYAHLFELLGHGCVVTVDVEKLHELKHSRVTCLIGSSVDPGIVSQIRDMAVQAGGPIMVILDSDHSEAHVSAELAAYAPFVSPGSYMLVQDGVIDRLPALAADRPGPLPAVEKFLTSHPEFEVDGERCERFLITHHPKGWLRRKVAQ